MTNRKKGKHGRSLGRTWARGQKARMNLTYRIGTMNMTHAPSKTHIQTPDILQSDVLSKAISMLYRELSYAADAKRDIWDFSIDLADFKAANILNSELRWLLAQGYIVHAQELSQASEPGRKFVPIKSLAIPDRSSFVLTRKGVQLAVDQHSKLDIDVDSRTKTPSTYDSSNQTFANGNGVLKPPAVPQWDSLRRELCLAAELVKRFNRPAPNQENILSTFQEQHWPQWIADPFPVAADQQERPPSRRLQDAIRALNRNQLIRLIHFRGDGKGGGVVWESM